MIPGLARHHRQPFNPKPQPLHLPSIALRLSSIVHHLPSTALRLSSIVHHLPSIALRLSSIVFRLTITH